MGKDYYKILAVDKKADDNQIKAAYKKAALKHHPDRNRDNQEEASKRFKEAAEAFEVLSDGNKRAVYDQFGEAGLKGRGGPSSPSHEGGFSAGAFPGGGMGGFPGGAFSFSSGGSPGGGGFTPADPNEIFSKIFGSGAGPFADILSSMGATSMGMNMGMGGGGPSQRQSRGGNPFGSGGMDVDDSGFSMPGGFGGGARRASGGQASPTGPELPETVKPHPFALEDLYKGGVKKLKVMRKTASGREEPVIVEVPIKPGWKAGTKIRFADKGNEDSTGRAATLCIEVQQKPHATFTRDGDDLIHTIQLSLLQSLTGASTSASSSQFPTTTFTVETLDGRTLTFAVTLPNSRGGTPISPGQVVKKFVGEGMPVTKKGSGKVKGDLLVKAEIEFPARVTPAQVEGMKRLFGVS